jgi:hypothetical protein
MLRASDPKQIETVSFPARARHDTTGRLFFLLLFTGERKEVARSLGLRLHRDSRPDSA